MVKERFMNFGHEIKKNRALFIMVLPAVLLVLVLSYLPMSGLILAFKNYRFDKGVFGSDWNGIENFRYLFSSGTGWLITKNTILYNLLNLITSQGLAIVLAIVISELQGKYYKKITQSVIFFPYFISWVIVAGILTAFFSQSRGLVSELIIKLGISDKGVSFLTNPDAYYQLAVWTSIWKSTGWWSIIFLAAISGIDPGLYEAAMVDGAGRLKRIWHITLPGILPAIVTVLILSVGSFLGGGMMGGNFDQTMMLGNKLNASASEIVQTYAFKTGMVDLRFNYATAIDLMQSIISVVLIFATNAVSKKVTDTGLF